MLDDPAMNSSPAEVLFRPVSVGALIRKITEVNPELNVQEVLNIVKAVTLPPSAPGQPETFDEKHALELARQALHGSP